MPIHRHRWVAGFPGTLQADAYSGFAELYEPAADDEVRVREAACPSTRFLRAFPSGNGSIVS